MSINYTDVININKSPLKPSQGSVKKSEYDDLTINKFSWKF